MLRREVVSLDDQEWEAWWVAAMRYHLRPWYQRLFVRRPKEPRR